MLKVEVAPSLHVIEAVPQLPGRSNGSPADHAAAEELRCNISKLITATTRVSWSVMPRILPDG